MEYNIVAKEIAQKVFKDSGLPNIWESFYQRNQEACR